MATVYGIVKQSGGHIVVDSQAGGEHLSWCTCLLLRSVPFHAASTRCRRRSSWTETILLAEDEDAIRTLVRRVLQHNGYNVIEARHGLQALKESHRYSGRIHLLLTDIVMPEMTGPELARRLIEWRPGTPILFMTGYWTMHGS